MNRTAHVAIYDSLADWEPGYLLAELRTGRFTGEPWNICTVAQSVAPITTMGGLQITPEIALDELAADESDLLILPGSGLWDQGQGHEWGSLARSFLDRGRVVAAICGATAGLAREGLLDDRLHTSAALQYLEAQPGYSGSAKYREQRAVADQNLVTAGPQSPVHFASATLGLLGLAPPAVLRAYEDLFADGKAEAYEVLMSAAG